MEVLFDYIEDSLAYLKEQYNEAVETGSSCYDTESAFTLVDISTKLNGIIKILHNEKELKVHDN